MQENSPLFDACLQFFALSRKAIDHIRSRENFRENFDLQPDEDWFDLGESERMVLMDDLVRFGDSKIGDLYYARSSQVQEQLLKDERARTALPDQETLEKGGSVAYDLSDIVDGAAYELWAAESEEELDERVAAATLCDWLDNVAAHKWIAFVPLERRFEAFPEVMNFGIFQIINARAGKPGDHRDPLKDFQRIVADHLDVTFMNPLETTNSYLDQAQTIYRESSAYIPGRPLLAMPVGSGHPSANERLLGKKLAKYLPLLRLTQLACDLTSSIAVEETPPALMPDGKTAMPYRIIEVPTNVLAIDKRSGQAQHWDRRRAMEPWMDPNESVSGLCPDLPDDLNEESLDDWLTKVSIEDHKRGIRTPFSQLHRTLHRSYLEEGLILDSADGPPYSAAEFRDCWDKYVSPVWEARVAYESNPKSGGKVISAINAAIELVTSSLYGIGGNVMLNAIVATETVLNPFDQLSDLTERFALFSAALTTDNPKHLRSAYLRHKELYTYRCKAVHSSRVFGKDGYAEIHASDAVRLFLKCVTRIAGWLTVRLKEGKPCSEKAFKEFYLDSVIPDK